MYSCCMALEHGLDWGFALFTVREMRTPVTDQCNSNKSVWNSKLNLDTSEVIKVARGFLPENPSSIIKSYPQWKKQPEDLVTCCASSSANYHRETGKTLNESSSSSVTRTPGKIMVWVLSSGVLGSTVKEILTESCFLLLNRSYVQSRYQTNIWFTWKHWVKQLTEWSVHKEEGEGESYWTLR